MSAQKAPPPKPPYTPTKLPGGPQRIIDICEALRTRNEDGYLPGWGGRLAKFAGYGGFNKGTTCSPFTATVIGVAFDPKYPRDDLGGDPYVPMFNGGNDPLPFGDFYGMHNANDSAVKSVVKYALAREIDMSELRRGDLVEINWHLAGGHVVFCWDVHLDDKGKVDAIQIIGSNGPYPGVSIHGCFDKRWLVGANAKYSVEVVEVEKKGKKTKETKVNFESHGSYKKAPGKDPIFADGDDVVITGTWHGLPGYGAKDIRLDTFRVRPGKVTYAQTVQYTVGSLRCARFTYDDPPPAPQCMRGGPPPPPAKPGHTETPAVVVKGADIQRDAKAPDKVPARPAKQESDKILAWQHFVEHALQMFFHAKWIDHDPGKADDINDPKTQAALKELQAKFGLKDDGIVGQKTFELVAGQLPACQSEYAGQVLLGTLFKGKKLQKDPGPPDGINNAKTRDAVEEFQSLHGLRATKVPDTATLTKLNEVLDASRATTDKPGLSPVAHSLCWVGNQVESGGTARLRLHSRDLMSCESCAIHLEDAAGKTTVESPVRFSVDAEISECDVPIPFPPGAAVRARVVTQSAGELTTLAPLQVARGTEAANWRPYIGQDSVPDDVLETIRRNRAKYPSKTLPPAGPPYEGEDHYDYKPSAAHQKWAKDYFRKKLDAAATHADKYIAEAFLTMLDKEGLPASMQTFDNQIVTWGVGLGAKGDGVHAFTHLDADPSMKKLLDDLGINYDHYDYHVVDLASKKVVSSDQGKVWNDGRHVVALEAWRRQSDLLSAIIGISEDPATREAVAESQWAVYLSNSTTWKGQDKIYSRALYFMITHLSHWMPKLAKEGIHVEREFAAIGGGEPSAETDKQIATRVARSYVAFGKQWFGSKSSTYLDVRTRMKTRVWVELRHGARKEGFDPGELTYDDE